jgi:hypothetical protein
MYVAIAIDKDEKKKYLKLYLQKCEKKKSSLFLKIKNLIIITKNSKIFNWDISGRLGHIFFELINLYIDSRANSHVVQIDRTYDSNNMHIILL